MRTHGPGPVALRSSLLRPQGKFPTAAAWHTSSLTRHLAAIQSRAVSLFFFFLLPQNLRQSGAIYCNRSDLRRRSDGILFRGTEPYYFFFLFEICELGNRAQSPTASARRAPGSSLGRRGRVCRSSWQMLAYPVVSLRHHLSELSARRSRPTVSRKSPNQVPVCEHDGWRGEKRVRLPESAAGGHRAHRFKLHFAAQGGTQVQPLLV